MRSLMTTVRVQPGGQLPDPGQDGTGKGCVSQTGACLCSLETWDPTAEFAGPMREESVRRLDCLWHVSAAFPHRLRLSPAQLGQRRVFPASWCFGCCPEFWLAFRPGPVLLRSDQSRRSDTSRRRSTRTPSLNRIRRGASSLSVRAQLRSTAHAMRRERCGFGP